LEGTEGKPFASSSATTRSSMRKSRSTAPGRESAAVRPRKSTTTSLLPLTGAGPGAPSHQRRRGDGLQQYPREVIIDWRVKRSRWMSSGRLAFFFRQTEG
jgi:hypothetical protein